MARFITLAALLSLVACADDTTPNDGGSDATARDAGSDAADADASPRCEPPDALPSTCNLHAELCERRFDEVAYATSHNAMSNAEERWLAPNQNVTIPRQLEDGIRALMLDTHYFREAPVLCHGICTAGNRPLAEGLSEITEFLRCHPAEVLSIIFETYISAEDTRQAFIDSGLIDYVHVQTAGTPWPTLRELIDRGERLVVFTDTDGGTYDWYLDVWAHAFETPFSAEMPADLSCRLGRGDGDGALFIFNHFLTAPVALPSLAEMINHNPSFLERARTCEMERSHLPNFVTVDFHDIGDVLEVTDALNGL